MLAEAKAREVAERLAPKVTRDIAFDPITILAIVQIILALVKLLAECKADAPAAMASPSPLQRVRLRMAVRRHLRDHPCRTALTMELLGPLCEVGAALTEAELTQLFEEVE